MRKLNYLFLTLVLVMCGGTGLFAQDTIRDLIISELRWDRYTHFYIEYTNMNPTDSIFLGDFYYQKFCFKNADFVQDGDEVILQDEGIPDNYSQKLPDVMLGPGESFVYMTVQDALNGSNRKHPRMVHSSNLVQEADLFNHFVDWGGGDVRYREYPYIPELQLWGFDSLSVDEDKVPFYYQDGCGLLWTSGDSIVVMVDQALVEVNWDIGTMDNSSDASTWVSTAGIQAAHGDYTLVRKYSVKEGETNWRLAKGDNAATSSWMLIPHNDDLGHIEPNTIGNHGNFTLDYSSDVYEFDEAANTVTVPWGTEKFDSITNGMTLGKGMAWEYLQNGNFQDSLSLICKDNDTLILYACGNELQMKKFAIKVADPLDSENTVFGKRKIWYADTTDIEWDGVTYQRIGDDTNYDWGCEFVVDEYTDVMDTIGNVPFATLVDTFFTLLEKPMNSEWEIDFLAGEVSSEVLNGDILRVTAADGSTKEYYIQVNPYVMSDVLDLTSITWPDRPSQYMEGWGYDGFSDTIPKFSPASTSYTITLPPGTTNVPVLEIHSEEIVSMEIERATSLKGGEAERKTTIYLTSESDTSFRTITVLFDVLNPSPQKFIGDPIFSKIYLRDWYLAGGIEITNPTDVPIDLSNYMIVKTSGTTKADALTKHWENDSMTWYNYRYTRYVPGYKWGNYNEWQSEPGLLYKDNVSSFVDAKDSYVIWKLRSVKNDRKDKFDFLKTVVDVFMSNTYSTDPGVYYNPWNEPLNHSNAVGYPTWVGDESENTGIYYLLKITNDSVLLGSKPVGDLDDFKVVDVYGSTVTPWNISAYPFVDFIECWLNIRKPHVFVGDTILGQGNHLTNADEADWWTYQTYNASTVETPQFNRSNNQLLLGSHNLNQITGHLSIIYSIPYKVSRGFSENETIEGVSRGETVAQFLDNIIKADEDQVLDVTGKVADDAIAEGDVLVVTSKTGNVTKYTISTIALDGDPTLIALDTTVTVSDAAPYEVGGFVFGTSINTVLSKLETTDETAIINVLDGMGELVPLHRTNSLDSLVEVVASSDYKFEVIAEDGTVREYQLVPATNSSEACILSDVYSVSQDPVKIIAEVPVGEGVGVFLNGLISSQGATLELISITGQERTIGRIVFGDQIIVTSSDSKVTSVYRIQFIGNEVAYASSDVYTVDQVGLEITGVATETDVATFLGNMTASTGAVMMVLDSEGGEKTTGSILETDVLYVESGDGTNYVSYKVMLSPVSVSESVKDLAGQEMKIYPNPTSGVLYVENISEGSLVRVIDITGRTVLIRRSGEIDGSIDVSILENGIYLMNIEKDGEKNMTFRFVKK